MAQTRVDSVQKLTGFPPLVKNVPANWPTKPAPDKISLLFNYNSNNLYHKFSPFTNYHDSMLSGILSNKQPFVYTYIDEAQNSTFEQLPAAVKGLATAVNITPDTLKDVVRVSKFLVSSWGVQFLAKQLLIQRTAPFDETRLYNPLSPVLATVQPLTLGLGMPPIRHIEGGILTGLLNSVTSTVGIDITGGKFQTPTSAAPFDKNSGVAPLPRDNSGQGKGLPRGATASGGYTQLNNKWGVSQSSGILGGLIKSITTAAVQIFGTTPKQPKGTQVRADEGTYNLMALSSRLSPDSSAPRQMWYPSSKITIANPKGSTSLLNTLNNITSFVTNVISNPTSLAGNALSGLLSSGPGGTGIFSRVKFIAVPGGFTTLLSNSGLVGKTIRGKQTGYTLSDGFKYSNTVGVTGDFLFDKSDIMVQYSYYIQDNLFYPSKLSDPKQPAETKINTNLRNVINRINNAKTYQALTNTYSRLMSSGEINDPSRLGYNRMSDIPDDTNTPVTEEYNSSLNQTRTIDSSIKSTKNLKMASSFKSDGLNRLGVLGADRKVPKDIQNEFGIQWEKWNPYQDDLIAFHFYDVVNEKYIPFRATVKGISEGNTAYWDELRFIGRADQIYSYNGFSRTLSFTFNVVVGSVTELLPTWQKINYMASTVKPSNYTKGNAAGVDLPYNRFMVPPMFMITIGDLYKFQPAVITSLNVNIPDDAAWETLNQDNSPDSWEYLSGIITSPTLGNSFAQVPREAEIAVTCNLLEKERAIVGGSHFGHAPLKDNHVWGNFNIPTEEKDRRDYLPDPTDFSIGILSYNDSETPIVYSTKTPGKRTGTAGRAVGTSDDLAENPDTSPLKNPTPSADGINAASSTPKVLKNTSIGNLTDFTLKIPGT